MKKIALNSGVNESRGIVILSSEILREFKKNNAEITFIKINKIPTKK